MDLTGREVFKVNNYKNNINTLFANKVFIFVFLVIVNRLEV
ncbi:hypothetical protein PTRA_a1872 [Pseudoalteromonas translucida KMM 520]|uniref:Uncharacterized protein n=1 Tax=Pseudoalteromonas translucida KMM 520 TaxID=1315283 RepID=A0A0U2V4Z8_9GAMM|nr:hypothetical protein PTRA_a1872 [Pseudoalteromonas translucida KMM 520]